jgi:hypothetical protein
MVSPFLRALLRNDQMTVMTNNKVQAIQHPQEPISKEWALLLVDVHQSR